MIINLQKITENSKNYQLIEKNFKIINKKFFFKKKYYLIYGPNNFYFQVDKNLRDLNNYFPYFVQKKENSNFDNWCESIKETLNKNKKIVRNLKTSQTERNDFKKKFKV